MRVVTGLFTAALLTGSLLLFLLEPLFGRLVLPGLGGVPAVWNTCLVFFQCVLLLGYLYAWAATRLLSLRSQLLVHAALLMSALLVLPIRIIPGWQPPTESNPIPWLLGVLSVSIGLPFFVLSTTAPVLQHWFAHTGHPAAHDPYFLYRASNLGSMIGLLAYPIAVEPRLGVRAQGIAWSAGYVLFAGLAVACAAQLLKHPLAKRGSAAPNPQSRIPNPGPRWPTLARWVALAAVPASLLLGVTTSLSTDVAAVPLLWVVPLLLYLLTFVLAFAPRPWIPTRALTIALPLLVLPLVLAVTLRKSEPAWFFMLLHTATFAVAALLCHQQLAEERPPARDLTLFYLCLSAGGAAGGLFNALAAPLLFRMPLEYPLALAAAGLLKPYRYVKAPAARADAADFWMPALLGVSALAVLPLLGTGGSGPVSPADAIGLGVPAVICFAFSARPIRFGLGLLAIVVVGLLRPDPAGRLVAVERSFFGVHRVVDDTGKGVRWLWHGTTIHGGQFLEPGRQREPLTYYTPDGPAGQVFSSLAARGRPLSVAVVGLGAGGVAVYGRAGDEWTFFEIDPVVVRLARDSGLFSFLRQSRAQTEIVVGDGRLMLERSAKRFDVVFLDAFSSDAVPIHLLTREALGVYLDHLEPGGLILFNTTNRYLSVHRVIGDLATDAGMAHLWRQDRQLTAEDIARGKAPSEYVLVARLRSDFGPIAADSRWVEGPGPRGRAWTDDYANPFGILIW